jgi:hypothetical protein
MPDHVFPKVIEAQEFVVRDENGVVRARLGVTSHWKEPVFMLNDKKGIPRIYIEMVDDFPCLRFMQENGQPLFSFGRIDGKSPTLGLSRNDRTPALLVIAEEGKDVQVGLCKKGGDPVWVRLDDESVE